MYIFNQMIHFNKVMNIHAKVSRTFFKTTHTHTHTHSYYLVTKKVQMKKKSTNENTVNQSSISSKMVGIEYSNS